MNALKTQIWASALIRRAEIEGASGFIVRKGDEDAGAVLVKVSTLDRRAMLYRPIRNMSGERIWLSKGPLGDFEIEQMITKRAKMDPDIWVVEIEDREGRHFLTEPIELG